MRRASSVVCAVLATIELDAVTMGPCSRPSFGQRAALVGRCARSCEVSSEPRRTARGRPRRGPRPAREPTDFDEVYCLGGEHERDTTPRVHHQLRPARGGLPGRARPLWSRSSRSASPVSRSRPSSNMLVVRLRSLAVMGAQVMSQPLAYRSRRAPPIASPCGHCNRRERARDRKWCTPCLRSAAARQRSKTARAREQRLCPTCSEPLPATPNTCRTCRAAKSAASRVVYKRLKEAGTCVECKADPASPGRVRCPACLATRCEAMLDLRARKRDERPGGGLWRPRS